MQCTGNAVVLLLTRYLLSLQISSMASGVIGSIQVRVYSLRD